MPGFSRFLEILNTDVSVLFSNLWWGSRPLPKRVDWGRLNHEDRIAYINKWGVRNTLIQQERWRVNSILETEVAAIDRWFREQEEMDQRLANIRACERLSESNSSTAKPKQSPTPPENCSSDLRAPGVVSPTRCDLLRSMLAQNGARQESSFSNSKSNSSGEITSKAKPGSSQWSRTSSDPPEPRKTSQSLPRK